MANCTKEREERKSVGFTGFGLGRKWIQNKSAVTQCRKGSIEKDTKQTGVAVRVKHQRNIVKYTKT